MQPALQLALLLAILLPACKDRCLRLQPLRYPPHPGRVMVGVFFGPGNFQSAAACIFFRAARRPAHCCFSRKSAATVLMFIAGIETDIDRMREASVTAFVVALSGVIWPFFLGAGVGHCSGFLG